MMKKRAFSILELTVVLIAISFLAGMSLLSVRAQLEAEKQNLTEVRLKDIEEALLLFLWQNKRLPCPADLSTASNDSNYGYERISLQDPAVCLTSNNNIFNLDDNLEAVYMGGIPFQTLGLTREHMLDGWSNKLSYVVTRSNANSPSTNSNCASYQNAVDNHNDSQYICFRAQGVGNNSNNIKVSRKWSILSQDTAYVIISHGSNGLGGFLDNPNGLSGVIRNQLPSPQFEEDERENTNCPIISDNCSDTTLNDTTFSINGTGGFDDVIRYQTKDQMIYQCNKRYLNCID